MQDINSNIIWDETSTSVPSCLKVFNEPQFLSVTLCLRKKALDKFSV